SSSNAGSGSSSRLQPFSPSALQPFTVRFALGTYDRRRALVIDPVLLFSTYLGGQFTDSGDAIAVDGGGNVYVAGETNSPDFPVDTGPPLHGNSDAFITKLSPDGSRLYSTF